MTRPSSRTAIRIMVLCATFSLSACTALGADGPSSAAFSRSGGEAATSAPLILDVTATAGRRIAATDPRPSLASTIGEGAGISSLIAPGDQLSVSLYEAPPAVLFGVVDPRSAGDVENAQTAKGLAVSDQIVDRDGRLSVPFAGTIDVEGLTSTQVERTIVSRLAGKANQPQAIVRVLRKGSAEVAVVGEVANAGRFPLTPKGERLLDVIAAAGGGRQGVEKTSVQVDREGRSATVPLQRVLTTPGENIALQAGDVVTLLFQPYQFVAMGAVAKPAEYPFEATGISLAQALGRVGGLRQERADIKGVYLFRNERRIALPVELRQARPESGSVVPTIYRLDFRDPAGMFAARAFPMRDGDVLYVSTAPAADLQRLVNAVSSGIFSVVGLGRL